ncbi:hypothetical protein BMH25_14105 [Leucobacter sp. OLCALW19]|nr:hypothetical protein BMH25_14105 [Leucobacter sp. OLCALW19]
MPMPVTYAAVGASNAPDLLRFPPEGTTPFEESLLIGSGQERFLAAVSLLMTWGAHRASGETVADVVRGDGGQYAGLTFDEQGSAEAPAAREDHFGPDGEPYLTSGTTATISRNGGKQSRRIRVVYVIDEADRVGFAIGTADDNGAIGEELFLVEHRSDDTVWGVTRGFLGSTSALKGRSQIRSAIGRAKQHLEAMLPGVVPDAAPVEAAASEREPAAVHATPTVPAPGLTGGAGPASNAPAPAESSPVAVESTESDDLPQASAPSTPQAAPEPAPLLEAEPQATADPLAAEAAAVDPGPEPEPEPEPEPDAPADSDAPTDVDAPADSEPAQDEPHDPAPVTAKSWGKSKGRAQSGKSPGSKPHGGKNRGKSRGGKG